MVGLQRLYANILAFHIRDMNCLRFCDYKGGILDAAREAVCMCLTIADFFLGQR